MPLTEQQREWWYAGKCIGCGKELSKQKGGQKSARCRDCEPPAEPTDYDWKYDFLHGAADVSRRVPDEG